MPRATKNTKAKAAGKPYPPRQTRSRTRAGAPPLMTGLDSRGKPFEPLLEQSDFAPAGAEEPQRTLLPPLFQPYQASLQTPGSASRAETRKQSLQPGQSLEHGDKAFKALFTVRETHLAKSSLSLSTLGSILEHKPSTCACYHDDAEFAQLQAEGEIVDGWCFSCAYWREQVSEHYEDRSLKASAPATELTRPSSSDELAPPSPTVHLTQHSQADQVDADEEIEVDEKSCPGSMTPEEALVAASHQMLADVAPPATNEYVPDHDKQETYDPAEPQPIDDGVYPRAYHPEHSEDAEEYDPTQTTTFEERDTATFQECVVSNVAEAHATHRASTYQLSPTEAALRYSPETVADSERMEAAHWDARYVGVGGTNMSMDHKYEDETDW